MNAIELMSKSKMSSFQVFDDHQKKWKNLKKQAEDKEGAHLRYVAPWIPTHADALIQNRQIPMWILILRDGTRVASTAGRSDTVVPDRKPC